MIAAGAEVLTENGVATQLSSITYAQVFDHLMATRNIKVTYGSVHERIWNSIGEYQIAVIERAGLWAVDSRTGADLPAMTSRVIADGPPDHDTSDPQHTLHQALRRLGAHDGEGDLDPWSQWLASAAAMTTHRDGTPPHDAAVDAAVERYRTLDEQTADALRSTLDRLGLRPRSGILDGDADPVLVAARLLTALTDGTRLRAWMTAAPADPVARPGRPEGAAQTWTLEAIAMTAVVDLLFEPND